MSSFGNIRYTSQNRASRDFGSIFAVGLVVQLTLAAAADVAGSHAVTTVVCSTVARQTAPVSYTHLTLPTIYSV